MRLRYRNSGLPCQGFELRQPRILSFFEGGAGEIGLGGWGTAEATGREREGEAREPDLGAMANPYPVRLSSAQRVCPRVYMHQSMTVPEIPSLLNGLQARRYQVRAQAPRYGAFLRPKTR